MSKSQVSYQTFLLPSDFETVIMCAGATETLVQLQRMTSEVASILAMMGGASLALVQSHRQPSSLRGLLFVSVVTGLFNLVVLGASGVLREGDGYLAATHAVAGHLMLPLVAVATGLWLGTSLSGIGRRPLQALVHSLFLVLLCFLCLSNTWTGYLGPSRIDPYTDPATNLRFEVIHRWAVPILIGTMLLWWLRRLAAKPSGAQRVGVAEPSAAADRAASRSFE